MRKQHLSEVECASENHSPTSQPQIVDSPASGNNHVDLTQDGQPVQAVVHLDLRIQLGPESIPALKEILEKHSGSLSASPACGGIHKLLSFDAQSNEKSQLPASSPPHVNLDRHAPSITFRGNCYPASHDGAAFIQALLEDVGQWVSGTDICKRPNFQNDRPDRVCKRLHPELRRFIKRRPGLGYKLDFSALEEFRD